MDSSVVLPNVIDQHGQLRDPYSGNPLEDGQEGPGSIFYVPSSKTTSDYRILTGRDVSIPFSKLMETLRRAGFEGEDVFVHVTPSPEDINRVPSPPPPQPHYTDDSDYESSFGNLYRTECAYCWAVVRGKERERGFMLSEICQAAADGCSTCNVLQHGIEKFAGLIFPKYSRERVRLRQKENGLTRLLSETKAVAVCFDEYGGETITLTFDGSSKSDKTFEHLDYKNWPGLLDGPMSNATWDGRIVETSSYATILLIKDWLHTCSEEHYQCTIPSTSTLPVRVLDVSNCRAKLVETNGLIAPYVTLSHCWGVKSVIRLVKSSLEAMKRDILWASLSKTFQDSIMVTWRLGFRYLWIDALCILQDSVDDWEYHASRMARIYSNSQLTISASSGIDGTKGCFSSRLKEPYVLHSFDSQEIRNPLLWMPLQLNGKDRDGCLKNFTVRLKTPHGLYQNRRTKEPLLKRAWVFQEQILSPRIIHFASGELYFECKSHVACECSGWSLRSNSYQWETRWRKSHAMLLSEEAKRSNASDIEQTVKKRNEFEAYRALVETYTELDITSELDRLPALSGITFGRKDEYLAGIWRSLLIESLHWYPVSKSLRGIMTRRTFDYRAPSWSWASIEAPIRHVEKDFYKTNFSAKYVAKIVDASATPVGSDPRGRVTGGYLRIQGPMGEARVTAIGICEREGSEAEEIQKRITRLDPDSVDPSLSYREKNEDTCTYATLRSGNKEGRCYLDLPLALCRAKPAEVAVGQEVTCLVISSTTIMVLIPVPETPGSYTRVGLFQPKEEGWSFDTKRKSIFII